MRALARKFGTPLYVYQLNQIRRAAELLLQSIPEEAVLFYSLKANPHPHLVAELASFGLRSEISSLGELNAVLRAGLSSAGCLYTGPGKSPHEIRTALAAGVRLFSVESPTEYERLAEAAAESAADVRYLVRINAPQAGGGTSGLRMTGTASQFGIDLESALASPHLFQARGRLTPIGLHLYPATNIADPNVLAREFDMSIATAAQVLSRTGLQASLVDVGGGFAAPYAKPGALLDYRQLRAKLSTSLDTHLPGWRQARPQVAFESGRYLTAHSGTLITTVLDVKQSQGKTFVVLDTGTHTLGGMSGLGRIMAPGAQPSAQESSATGRDLQFSLVGPLCTPLDVLSRSASLPEPRVGDVLTIPNVGAYGLTASLLGFLSHPVAAEAVVDGEAVRTVRRLILQETEIEGDRHE